MVAYAEMDPHLSACAEGRVQMHGKGVFFGRITGTNPDFLAKGPNSEVMKRVRAYHVGCVHRETIGQNRYN